MRFPNPVAVTCLACGRPTVMAETALGEVRVHCGTWRWQCGTAGTSSGYAVGASSGYAVPSVLAAPDADSDQELVA
jgi:ribosomal protein S27AE